jgi:hypothetical protein
MPEDYLLRMIEESSIMLSSINAHRKAGRDGDAIQDIETACLERIGLPFFLIKRSSPEALLDLMQRSGARYVRSVLLADLLIQDAEINEAAGEVSTAICSRLQAFVLLASSIEMLTTEEKAFYRPKLNTLLHQLKPVSNDPYLQKKLLDYESKRPVG